MRVLTILLALILCCTAFAYRPEYKVVPQSDYENFQKQLTECVRQSLKYALYNHEVEEGNYSVVFIKSFAAKAESGGLASYELFAKVINNYTGTEYGLEAVVNHDEKTDVYALEAAFVIIV